jgi:hypothetical protein
MEPNDDPQLRQLLREWQVPGAPPSLDAKVLGRRRSWWSFLLSGQIHVPVPVGFAVAAALVVMTAITVRDHRRLPAQPARPLFNLRDFQPVQNIQVRVIRSNYANE